jgi:hypothetical protein
MSLKTPKNRVHCLTRIKNYRLKGIFSRLLDNQSSGGELIMSRHEISEAQRRDWRMLYYGAALLVPGRSIVGCLAQAGGQPFFNWLRRADVHAPRDVLLVGAAAIFYAR